MTIRCRVLAVGLVVLLAAGCNACLADTPQPVVGVDQYHYNLLSLSPQAVWKMATFRDELVACGYSVQAITGPITPAMLAGFDVLLVPTPDNYYTAEELAAIQAFASSGNGVVFGANYGVQNGVPTHWAPICQSLANALGFTLDNNWAFDATTNAHGYGYWITFGAGAIGQHPVTSGVNSVQCYSTTTLTGPVGSTALVSTDSDATPPLRPAIVAGAYGSGNVVVAGSCLYFADVVPNRDIGGGRRADMEGLRAADNRRFAYNAITWAAGAAGRPLVQMSLSAPLGFVYDTVEISGTVCDATLTDYVIEYAPAADPNAWTQVGAPVESSVLQGALGTWDVAGVEPGSYTLRVRATNALGNSFSRSAQIEVKRPVEVNSISELRGLSDGALVKIAGREVVAGSDDLAGRIYIEEQDRTAGIAVVTSETASRGAYAEVTGVLGVVDGAPAITAIGVTVGPGPADPLRPLGVANSRVGAVDQGLGTAGLLVRVWGKVVGSDANGFTIDDGSLGGGLRVLTVHAHEQITPPAVDSVVSVTGIGASWQSGSALIVRDAADILHVH